VGNGVLETFVFLSVFDAPRAALQALGVGQAASWGGAFAVYAAFAGWVHAAMWDRRVFPPHMRRGEPLAPFLVPLTLLSAAWLALWSAFGDLAWVVVSHVAVDGVAASRIRFPLFPWDARRGGRSG